MVLSRAEAAITAGCGHTRPPPLEPLPSVASCPWQMVRAEEEGLPRTVLSPSPGPPEGAAAVARAVRSLNRPPASGAPIAAGSSEVLALRTGRRPRC
jgi:hypothetical protein